MGAEMEETENEIIVKVYFDDLREKEINKELNEKFNMCDTLRVMGMWIKDHEAQIDTGLGLAGLVSCANISANISRSFNTQPHN